MSTPLPLRTSVAAGDWVVISGQLGIADGALVEGVGAQARQALVNFQAVLAEHGLTPADVVKTLVFLTTMDDFAAMNEEYAKVFSVDPPARSAIAVHQLPLGGLVEIEGFAYRGSGV